MSPRTLRPQGSPLHSPATHYTSGLPSLPRVFVPPPVFEPLSYLNAPPDLPDPSTSHPIDFPDFALPHIVRDWKYEQRREAQQLLPHLWLGPLSSLRQPDFLLTHNITQVINVRSHMSRGVRITPKLPPGVTYNSVDSTSPHDLASKFPLAADIIDSHLISALPPYLRDEIAQDIPINGRHLNDLRRENSELNGGITLLYCESGNDRSAAVATAYIMQHLDITAIQAIQYIQAKRFCISLDEWTKWTLASYEPIWKARKMSRAQHKQQGLQGAAVQASEKTLQGTGLHTHTHYCASNNGNGKRKMEDSDDEAEDKHYQNHSKGQAPFLEMEDEEMT